MNCHYAPLAQDALLHIEGPDALKFLQGQVTCDTRKIDATHARPGVYCTPQGRVVCDFLLFEVGHEHVALRMRGDIRANAAAVFGKYIVFSKARLDAADDDWRCVAVWGGGAAGALAAVFGGAPAEQFGVSHADGAILVQTDATGHHFECFLHSASVDANLARMAACMQGAGEAEWQAVQIAAGIARIEAATVGEFVPQVLNYDLTGHISFNKGCYTGQEVVARLHYRGKTKRRSYPAKLAVADGCVAGAPLFASASGQNVGDVVNCSRTPAGAVALVSATIDSAQHGLHLGAADGPTLVIGSPPYALGDD